MMNPIQKQCPAEERIPTCSTGPAGRIVFVIREISRAIRSRHERGSERKAS